MCFKFKLRISTLCSLTMLTTAGSANIMATFLVKGTGKKKTMEDNMRNKIVYQEIKGVQLEKVKHKKLSFVSTTIDNIY